MGRRILGRWRRNRGIVRAGMRWISFCFLGFLTRSVVAFL
jgi:hypothetical protein